MATLIRTKLLTPIGNTVISTGAATLGVCAADEVAVMVGTGVAIPRVGNELREAMELLAKKPRSGVTVAGGSVRTFLGAPGLLGDGYDAAAATVLGTTVPTETQVGLIVGATAAADLDKSGLVVAAVEHILAKFVGQFGF